MFSRIKRVNELLKEEIGNIIIREVDLTGVLVTITRVDASANLQEAKVYISVIPADKSEEVFQFLNRNIYGIQQQLNKRLNMRPVPKMIFKKEGKTEQAAKIEEILEDIKNKEK